MGVRLCQLTQTPMSDLDLQAAAQLQIGIEQFNQGDYYACHDTLEAIWMEASTLDKPFYQGILQFAVALYHLSNQNWQGAIVLLGEGLNRLQPFEPLYRGVDVTHLVDQGFCWLEALREHGPDQVATLAATISLTGETPIASPSTAPPASLSATLPSVPSRPRIQLESPS